MTDPARAPRPAVAEGHMPQLDGLRALAVFAVLLAHTMPWLHERFDLGAAGVRLFYVLSGFLITGILLRARAQAAAAGAGRGRVLRAFYARRFLRIFPPYYAALFAAAALALPGVRETFAWHVSYLSNIYAYLHGYYYPHLAHLWSLSVEEQFYLLWPAVVLFAPARALPALVVATVCVGPASRLLFAPFAAEPHRAAAIATSCLDTLGLGALLALAWESGAAAPALRRKLGRAALAAGAGLYLAVLASGLLKWGWHFRFASKDVAYGLLFFWLVDRAATGLGGPGGWLLEARPVAYVGRISYGVYLFHEFLPPLLRRLDPWLPSALRLPTEHGPARFLYVAAATLSVAALSWHLFEKPLNGLKKWFPYVRKQVARPAAVPAAAGLPLPGRRPVRPGPGAARSAVRTAAAGPSPAGGAGGRGRTA
jgi:peptidoglycan/LPS O-acetylase OafA/YrhL